MRDDRDQEAENAERPNMETGKLGRSWREQGFSGGF